MDCINQIQLMLSIQKVNQSQLKTHRRRVKLKPLHSAVQNLEHVRWTTCKAVTMFSFFLILYSKILLSISKTFLINAILVTKYVLPPLIILSFLANLWYIYDKVFVRITKITSCKWNFHFKIVITLNIIKSFEIN